MVEYLPIIYVAINSLPVSFYRKGARIDSEVHRKKLSSTVTAQGKLDWLKTSDRWQVASNQS